MHAMHTRRRTTLPAIVLAALWAAASAQAGPVVAFENLPTNLDGTMMESRHGVGGPVLADDFVTTLGGSIKRVEWWGSRANSNNWELAFHTNNPALGQPNVDNPVAGAMLKIGQLGDLVALGVADDPLRPDIYRYSVDIAGPDILAGVNYWFTVANFAAGWQWAQALGGPTVGSEDFNVHRSIGAGPCLDGGPHCGPWVDLHTDTAFRMSVPEPGSLLLVALSGLLLTATTRRRNASGGTDRMPLAV